MEKIGFYLRTTKTKNIKVNYRLRVGRDVQMFHRSDIKADLADLNKLEPNGAAKPRISIYNESLAKQLVCSKVNFPHFRFEKGTT